MIPDSKPSDIVFPDFTTSAFNVLDNAIAIATYAHHGQVDKNGRPYILHLIRVMMRGRTDDERILGILHDIIEDTNMTYQELFDEGIPERILVSLDAITHRHWYSEHRERYYNRVLSDELAHVVKEYDVDDNNDPARLVADEETAARFIKKYTHCREYLGYTSYDVFVRNHPNAHKG